MDTIGHTFTIGCDLWPYLEGQLAVSLDVCALLCGWVGIEGHIKRLVELGLAVDLTIGLGLDFTVGVAIGLAIDICNRLGLDLWSDNFDLAIDLISR